MKIRDRERADGYPCLAGLLAIMLVTAIGADAQACAVCYGDPNSGLVKGAIWGVLLLFGVIGSVLITIASLAVFWTVRARRLSASGFSSLAEEI